MEVRESEDLESGAVLWFRLLLRSDQWTETGWPTLGSIGVVNAQ